jgi:hypothetical protein
MDLSQIYQAPSEAYGGWNDSIYPYPVTGSGGGGSDFWKYLGEVTGIAGGILGTRYSVPQLNQGQYIQSGPYGTTMMQNAPNTQYPYSVSSMLGGGMSGMLPILLIGGVVLLVVMKGKG